MADAAGCIGQGAVRKQSDGILLCGKNDIGEERNGIR